MKSTDCSDHTSVVFEGRERQPPSVLTYEREGKPPSVQRQTPCVLSYAVRHLVSCPMGERVRHVVACLMGERVRHLVSCLMQREGETPIVEGETLCVSYGRVGRPPSFLSYGRDTQCLVIKLGFHLVWKTKHFFPKFGSVP